VSFHDDRLENPARVFVDLPATRAIDRLKDRRFDSMAISIWSARFASAGTRMRRRALSSRQRASRATASTRSTARIA
jgi:hypothetical protein